MLFRSDIQEPFSEALISLRNLRTLSAPYPDLSRDAFGTISQRSLLGTLYCTISAKHAPLLRTPHLHPIFFAGLRVLNICCEPNDLGTLARFLSVLSAPSSLDALQIQSKLGLNLEALPILIAAIGRFKNLCGLVLHLDLSADAAIIHNPFDLLLDSSILSPLLALHRLKLLDLQGIPIAFWQREGIPEFSKAWPRLSHFALYHLDGPDLSLLQPVMCLSLEDLSYFAIHCPMLERIRVSLQPIPAYWAYNRTSDLPLSFAYRIDWKGSQIAADAVEEVSSYLASVFPLARLTDDGWGSRPRTTEEAVTTEIQKARDNLVSESIGNLHHERDSVWKAHLHLTSGPEYKFISSLRTKSYRTFR